MSELEKKNYRRKVKAEFGYALMWAFALFLLLILPLLLDRDLTLLQYALSAGSLSAAGYKVYRGVQLSRTRS